MSFVFFNIWTMLVVVVAVRIHPTSARCRLLVYVILFVDPQRVHPSCVCSLFCHTPKSHFQNSVANQIALLLSAGWAGVQISRTMTFDKDFARIVTNGSCNGINLLPYYLPQRNILLIAIVAINSVGVLLFGFFSFKLFHRFTVKSFERVGSNVPMKQAYIVRFHQNLSSFG